MNILHLLSFLYCLLLLLLLLPVWTALSLTPEACPELGANMSIGVVVDESSRVGKEQKIAMKLSVQDLRHCLNIVLHFKDLHGNSARAASAANDLVNSKHVDAILGTLTLEEASLLSQLKTLSTPIISLSSAPSSTPLPPQSPPFAHMGVPVSYQMQCAAAIVGHFQWRKVILIHEQSQDPDTLFTYLSYALKAVGSTVDHHVTIPRVNSSIERELKKVKSHHVRVFVVAQSSLEFAATLFDKAKVMGMMEKGYVWIVSDDVSNLLDSLASSLIFKMQGIVALKSYYSDDSDDYRAFKFKFRRKYASKYPLEEEHLNPSIYALRAYDSISAAAYSFIKSQSKIDPNKLFNFTDFQGLSGKIAFTKGFLSHKPIFHIVNVIGRSYREVAIWSPEIGFSNELVLSGEKAVRLHGGATGDLSSIYWPGGGTAAPKGWSLGSREKPLKIGVPARGAFNQFVKVMYDSGKNTTQISGFSIDVFEAAIKKLPYDLYYVLIPYYGSYDEMITEVHNKSLDAAVGDTEIMADRYIYAEFSQPYMESGLVMVVTVKPGVKESKLIALNPFTSKMWLQLGGVSMATGAIIWLSEYATGNEQFTKNSLLQIICSILWLSVTIISFSQRENIKSSASKLVLAAWICVIFVVGASFTAVLSSMMTVPRLEPSIREIDFLRNSNAVVGCNRDSFICRYLINVLNFSPKNVKMINSIDEYPPAFGNGEIKAAFFVAPHAKVFLAKYCNGYMVSGPSFKLGGFGFVFQKGSPLAIDISEAILKVSQSGDVDILEQNMLHHSNCTLSSLSASEKADDIRLGPGPFSSLFLILGCILGFTFLVATVRLLRMRWIRLRSYVCELVIVMRERITRFSSTIFGEERVEMNAVHNAQMEPNLVAVDVALNHR